MINMAPEVGHVILRRWLSSTVTAILVLVHALMLLAIFATAFGPERGSIFNDCSAHASRLNRIGG